MGTSTPARRADAARNHARIVAAALKLFSAHGAQARIAEVAREAGVGPGTIYRHFPTKEDLFRAVVSDRVAQVIDQGDRLSKSLEPGGALVEFLRIMVLDGGQNRALAEVVGSSHFEVEGPESQFREALEGLLFAAQAEGAARNDVRVRDVQALLAACYAVGRYGEDLTEPVFRVMVDGLMQQNTCPSSVQGNYSMNTNARN